jgi:hypothetical protein
MLVQLVPTDVTGPVSQSSNTLTPSESPAMQANGRESTKPSRRPVKPPRPSLSRAGGTKLPGSRDDAFPDPRKFFGASVVLQWLQDMRKSAMGGSDRC